MTKLANKIFESQGFLGNLFFTKKDRIAVEDFGNKLAQTLRRLERKDQMERDALGLV